MKTLLDCERVFDLLTRGPFPSGDDSDLQVAEHLEVCHECRELAEALRPAVDVLHESLLAVDRVGLPCYDPSGTVVNESSSPLSSPLFSRPSSPSAMAEIMNRVREASNASSDSAVEVAGSQNSSDRLASYFSVVSIAAALAVVLLVAAILPWHGRAGASAAVPKTEREKRDYLLQLGVSESCLQTTTLASSTYQPVSPHEGAADCCTDCHFAADDRSPAASDSPHVLKQVPSNSEAGAKLPMPKQHLVVLANSCLACHVSSPH